MRLQAYLDEGNNLIGKKTGRSVPIDVKDAKKTIIKECKNAMRSTPIYRGVNNDARALFIEPKKSTRLSEYTDNYYMLLFQLLPSWKKYPKLSKSVIGVTSVGKSTNWASESFRVYPYDGYDIGVCPAEHFWGSFKKVNGMDILNEKLMDFLDYYNRDHKQLKNFSPKETDPNVLKAEFEKIDKLKLEKTFDNIFEEYFFVGEKVIKTFDRIFSSEDNGFSLEDSGSTYNIPFARQIWTEAPCILLSKKEEKRFKKG